jgi:hypothetical protein
MTEQMSLPLDDSPCWRSIDVLTLRGWVDFWESGAEECPAFLEQERVSKRLYQVSDTRIVAAAVNDECPPTLYGYVKSVTALVYESEPPKPEWRSL